MADEDGKSEGAARPGLVVRRPAERVVGFYKQRGTAEQWIKEGKNSIKWTPLVPEVP